MKDQLAAAYALFHYAQTGIGAFAGPSMHDEVFDRLNRLDRAPMTKVELNQLLVLSKAGSMSDGCFQYYWGSVPAHPYDVTKVPFFPGSETNMEHVASHDHLKWGLYRLYVDALLYFGNISAAYDALRSRTLSEVTDLFQQKRFDTDAIARRGPPLPLQQIAKDDRYLISEMVCKTFGDVSTDKEEARQLLLDGLKQHAGTRITFRQLLEGVSQPSTKDQFLLSFDDVLDTSLLDAADVNRRFDEQFDKFFTARRMATRNTELYLSMVNDLDIYVATSMRNRQNFRDMASICERIFTDSRLEPFHLRYFDPTMSAARGHEDKGLIECLMVKSAKVVIYTKARRRVTGRTRRRPWPLAWVNR